MTGSVSSTSLILTAETLARGIMINTIDIMRKAIIISTAYCMKAIILPTCMVPALTSWAPTQIMRIMTAFIRNIIVGIKTTSTARLTNRLVFVRSWFALSNLSSSCFCALNALITINPVRCSRITRLSLSINFCIDWNLGRTMMNMTTIMVISIPTAAPMIQSIELASPSTLRIPPIPRIGA